jgi:hypothetical protein
MDGIYRAQDVPEHFSQMRRNNTKGSDTVLGIVGFRAIGCDLNLQFLVQSLAAFERLVTRNSKKNSFD